MDESLYPPRCCRMIMPHEDIEARLAEQLTTEFEGTLRSWRISIARTVATPGVAVV